MSELPRNSYPRSLPFQPPQDLADREARLRRRTYCLFGGAALLLVLAVAAEVFVMKTLHPPTEEATEDETPPPPRPTPAKDKTSASHPEVPAVDRAREKRVKAAARAQHEFFLQTIALLTAAHLYHSYLNMTLLADGVTGGTYQKDAAIKMLGEVTNTLNVVDDQLGKLEAAGLDPEDRKDVARVRKLSGQLRAQARELKAYWEKPGADQAQKYQQARAAAWAGIRPLLGIDKD